jgi:hypothetical protein
MNRIFSILLTLAILFSLCSVTQNAQAAPLAAPSVVSGVVTDAGHGYPLYARITISGGASQVLYTHPFTGAYSVNLTTGLTYVFDVEALGVPGYELKSDVFIPATANYTRNISLRASNPNACTTPGYARTTFFNTDFETNNGGFSAGGQNSSWGYGSPTSGPWGAHSGSKVWATNLGGYYNNDEHSVITHDAYFDLSGRRGIQIHWWQWLQTYDNFDYAVVQVSNNGGSGWGIAYGNEYPWVTTTQGDMSGNFNLSWVNHTFALDSSWAVSNFMLRFKFKSDWNLIGTAAPGWYIDDLSISTCEPVAGGLVGGYVTDANSGAPLNDVLVQHLVSGQTATSIATPGDPDVGDGLYFVFVPGSGGTSLTVSKALYATTSYAINLTSNTFNRLDMPLPPNYDTAVSADQQNKSGLPNSTVTYNLTLTNTGFLPGELLINPVTLPPGPLWPPTLSQFKTTPVLSGSNVPVTVTVSIPPFTPTGTVSTAVLRTHWIGILFWVLPPGAQEITLTTTALNAPPQAQAQSLTTAEETLLDLTLFALDPNGDPVSYNHTQPAHGSLSGTLPFLTYTPQTDYFGLDFFTFTASDGTLSSSDTLISINVTNVNDAPVATTTADVEWLAREAHNYLINPFTDVDGDSLTYSATVGGAVLPAWLSLDPATGEFTGTPSNGDVGGYEIEVAADDGHGGTASTTFTLTVTLNPFKVFLPIIGR